MSLHLNHVIIAGHLTRDPLIRSLASNRCVASFSLAINRRYKTAEGEAKEETTFVECEAWGRTAEIVGQYLVKGSACCVEGRLKMDAWDDKDGQKRTRIKVVADQVQLMGRGKGQDSPSETPETASLHDAMPEAQTTNTIQHATPAINRNKSATKMQTVTANAGLGTDETPF